MSPYRQIQPHATKALLLFSSLSLMLTAVSCKHKEEVVVRDPIEVEIMVLDTFNETFTRTYIGEVEANENIVLNFATGGKVEKVLVREGDHVHEGQSLVTIDRRTAQNAYNSAKAQFDQAQDAYERLKKVYDQGSLAEVKWVEMLSTLEQARSMEQIARKQLEDCALIAPCSGVIGECNATAGGSLLPGEPIITLLDIDQVVVNFSVPESEIATVNEGREVTILIPALNNRQLIGKVSERSMNASKISHSYNVKVQVSNADHQLRPGMVCKVNLPQSEECGIIVPAKCVQTRPEGQSIWIIHQGKAEQRAIHASQFVSNGVLIDDGLHPGDTIITAGMQRLYQHADIQIIP